MTPEQRKYAVNLAKISGCIIVILYFILSSLKSNSSYTFPRSVISHDEPKIDGGEARFRLKLPGLSYSTDLFETSKDIEDIAKHEVESNQSEGSILFTIVGEGKDLYGNSVQDVYAFDLQFSMDDLKKVKWDDLDGMQLLNLGQIVSKSPAGENLISGYCEDNRVSSEVFCAAGTQ